MRTRTDLLEIIANGENSSVEFKRDYLQTQDLAKELVAFSNFEGGIVLLGVDDDGTVTGISRANLEEWVMNVCRDKVRPAINPHFDIVKNIKDSKDIGIVRVTRGLNVHALWHNNSSKYLIRVGTQSREASVEELARLIQQRSSVRAELQTVSGARLSNLDRRRLRNYFKEVRQQTVPDDNDEKAWHSLLFNTEVLTEEGVSVGGMLLFGATPIRLLPHSGIDAVAFPGKEKVYEAKERIKLRASMTPLLNDRGEIVENGLVELALEFVRRNTRINIERIGGRRVERPEYPSDVLRECIVNALIHRDYMLINSDIEMAIYCDRFEIISPGRLTNGITPEHMRAGVRSARNLLLKDVMRDYRYLEHMGMGIPRKIIKGMKNHNGTEPDLEVHGERFLLRLYA